MAKFFSSPMMGDEPGELTAMSYRPMKTPVPPPGYSAPKETPPHPKVRRRLPGPEKGPDQPKLTAVLRRARKAPPIAPKPPSIKAQLAGSGAGELLFVKTSFSKAVLPLS